MRRILLFAVLFMLIFGITCFAEDITKENTGHLTNYAGKTIWFDSHKAYWLYNSYMNLANITQSNDKAAAERLSQEGRLYYDLAQQFQYLEEANIGIIDLDNYIVLINKHDGTTVTANTASSKNLIDLFTLGSIIMDDPFNNGESEQDIYDIKNGIMHIGFNKEQAELCWGKPGRKNKTTTYYGTNEQWIYNGNKTTYLYLENNHVTAWQN